MPADDILLVRREGATLVLAHNSPATRNALSPQFYQALCDALEQAAADAQVGAIILTGEGGHFCSGGNLHKLAVAAGLPLSQRLQRIDALHRLVLEVANCPKPVIAAVEGAVAGAGVSLALACDMLVASREAFFTMAYVKVGLTPDGGATAWLAEFVSRQVLTELCLTGQRITAERLHALGAVNRLSEPGQALAQALDLAQTMQAGPPRAMARIKTLCRNAHRQSLHAQLELEARHMAIAMGGAEARAGIAAFLEKRPANFSNFDRNLGAGE